MTTDFDRFPPLILSITFFPILILEKKPVLPFLILNAKQGNYWYHFYNVWRLNPGPHTLEASTLPLGYQGSCRITIESMYLGGIKLHNFLKKRLRLGFIYMYL